MRTKKAVRRLDTQKRVGEKKIAGPSGSQPEENQPKQHVFVSYARANEIAVQAIVSRLQAWGYRVWLDQYDLQAGEIWQKNIENAIRGAEAFLLMMSPAAAKSKMVEWELGLAERNKVRVIPVVIQSGSFSGRLKGRLDALHHISFLKDRHRGATALVEALGGLRGTIPRIPGDTEYPAIRENARMIVESVRFVQEVANDGGNAIFYGGTDWSYYVQLAMQPNDPKVYGEAVSNANLKRSYRLTAEQIEKLHGLGWEKPNKTSAGNYHKTWQVRLDKDRGLVAGEAMHTFLDVYHHYLGERLKIELQLHS
jgi:TIR domain/T3SS (YopN, CesT) and YbjN peptide-binding chaperone 3